VLVTRTVTADEASYDPGVQPYLTDQGDDG
jgi:hypothetical protein